MAAKTKKIEFKNIFAHKSENKGPSGYLLITDNDKALSSVLKKSLAHWQIENSAESKGMIHFIGKDGPVWIFKVPKMNDRFSHHGMLEESHYSHFRDQVGSLMGLFKALKIKNIDIEFDCKNSDVILGALVGLKIASYNFKDFQEGKQLKGLPAISIINKDLDQQLQQAITIGDAINFSRHLVNLPPNLMNPKTFCEIIEAQFGKAFEVDIWDHKKLQSEGMGLLLAVGSGSQNPPCLMHLKYRPKKSKHKPIAFVGKGITFDSGGYDIKPSSGMRLMKKDMGGAACLAGLAHWVSESDSDKPLDFYFAMAENMVDQNAFRPSDVYTARNGLSVEIHNTDAEGRLVLADAIDVAVTQKDEPQMVINVATLTGAIKVALGAELAGLFSNDDQLSDNLIKAGQHAGDLMWRMPLYGRYTSQFSSPFADIVNAVDGFGGAITAALFLEKFCRNKSWAHLDIYAWNDKPTGGMSFSGGNGQGVQALIQFLTDL
jgi:leucyl aminopeptidase